MPVYEWNPCMHTYKVSEIAQALLESSPTHSNICHRTPTNVEHNCTFLVDQSKLKLQSDLKADDCGAGKNNGVRCVVIFLRVERQLLLLGKRKLKPTK